MKSATLGRILAVTALIVLFGAGLLHVKNHFIDYPVYELAAKRVRQGQISELYDLHRTSPGGYYYSYFFALVFIPFTWAGNTGGKILFFLLFFVCYLKILKFSLDEAIAQNSALYAPVTLITIFLTTYSVNDAFMDANIGILLLTFCLLAFERREKNPTTAGLFLSLAIVFKIYPVILLGYFIWEKRFKLVAVCCFTFVIFYFLVPIVIYGTGPGSLLVTSQWQVVGHFGEHWSFDSTKFQNWPSSFTRLTESFGLPKSIGFRLSIGTICFFTLLFYLKSFFLKNSNEDFRRRMFLLCLALVPIGVPVSWYNMGLFYTPVISWMLAEAILKKDRTARIAILIFAVFYCLTTPDLVGTELNHYFEKLSIPFFGAFILTADFARRIRRDYSEEFFGPGSKV
jgi:hypothetical protein